MIVYLDTSAAAKLVVREPESDVLQSALDALDPGDRVASSRLLETELRRLAVRRGADQRRVSDVLDRVDLYEITPSMFVEAGVLPGPHLRSLDALHLAVALHLGCDLVVAYDARMVEAAGSLGLSTASPA